MNNSDICYQCNDRPEGCWRTVNCSIERAIARNKQIKTGACPIGKWTSGKDSPTVLPRSRAVSSRVSCPSCDLIYPSVGNLEDVHTVVQDILTRNLTPPPFQAPMGIVTCGEGKYEAGIVIGIKILRDHVKCDLPITVFHRGNWGTDLKGYDVTLTNSEYFQQFHPAQQYGGWESKSYAVIHSGYERCMFLDGDAYLVKDPAPLFKLLDDNGFVCWADFGPGWACGQKLDNLVIQQNHQNGGEFLVNLKTWWTPFVAKRFLDDHSHIYYKEGRLGDECSTRLVRHLIHDKGVVEANWVNRKNGVGVLCRYPKDGPAYVVHRMRKESKLFLDQYPTSCGWWPYEKEVLAAFKRMLPPSKRAATEAAHALSREGRMETRLKLIRKTKIKVRNKKRQEAEATESL